MTAPSTIHPAQFLHEHLSNASPDLLRSLLTTIINTLMSAKADAVCGAPCGQPSPERTDVRSAFAWVDHGERLRAAGLASDGLSVGLRARLSVPTTTCRMSAHALGQGRRRPRAENRRGSLRRRPRVL